MLTRRAAIAFGVVHLLTAGLIVLGVFVGLPSRWTPVDVSAGALAIVEALAGGGLLLKTRWARPVAFAAAAFALVIGLGVVTVLALTASWLAGVYGPVGRGGGIILALVAAMLVPYLVVVPAMQLFWMLPRPPASR